MLLYASTLWPRRATFRFNAYCGWSMLIVKGASKCLHSEEGVTQGDP